MKSVTQSFMNEAGMPVALAAVLKDDGSVSLTFVTTMPDDQPAKTDHAELDKIEAGVLTRMLCELLPEAMPRDEEE